MFSLNIKNSRHNGFTLLELLIVIAIIAILSIALVFMLNPAETLKKARDAQRISDLKSVKTALGIMLTASSTPSLDSGASVCTTNTAGAAGGLKIAYSADATITFASTAFGSDGPTSGSFSGGSHTVAAASAGKVDGNGWIPVNLKALTGGTPISSFPVDPVNTISVPAAATSTDLVYRYACQNGTPTGSSKPAYIFELNTRLESNAYTVEDNKMANDGGDNPSFYETGNSLNLLPSSTGF